MVKDKLQDVSCSEWVKSHSRAEYYLNYLIERGQLAPAQADWLIKVILLDDLGLKYESDNNQDACAFEVWSDIQSIPGNFYQLKK